MSSSSLALHRPAERAARETWGPHGWRLLRAFVGMRRNRLRVVTETTRDYGDLAEFRLGPKRVVLAAHPDAFRRVLVDNAQNYVKGLGLSDARSLLGDGLLTSEGALWARHKKVIQQGFHTLRLDDFAGHVVAAARATADGWAGGRGTGVDVGRDMLRLALRAFSTGALRLDASPELDSIIDDFAVLERWAMTRSVSIVRTPIAMPTPANLAARRALARLDAFAEARLKSARATPTKSGLLAAILELEDAEPPGSRAGRDELLTLLLAGHETTGAALSWSLWCLAHDDDARRRLHEELNSVLAGRDPTHGDVPRLTFARAVVEEALRMYPPVWLIPRRAIGADELGGLPIGPGTDVLLSVYSVHRNPEFWDAPEHFHPGRCCPAATPRSANAYMPFGVGMRACLGSRLAIVETILALAVLVQRCDVRWPVATLPRRQNPALTLHFPMRACAVVRPN